MNDPKTQLAHAYAYSYRTPNSAVMGRKTTNPKKAPVIRYKKRRGVEPHNAHQTRSSCINTTALCAKGIEAGRILSQAEKQWCVCRLWLQYVYDPTLDIHPSRKAHIKRQLVSMVYGMWCYWPHPKPPATSNVARLAILFGCVFDDAVKRARNPRATVSSCTYKAEQMGYGHGKAAYQSADYSRHYKPFERDIMRLLQWLDDIAMQPFVESKTGKRPQPC